MNNKIFSEIYGKTPASFSVPGSPENAARLLSQQTHHGFFSTGIVGKASVDRVVLRQSYFFYHNSFASQYYGRFIYDNGQTKLTGYFMLSPIVQIFMTIWFGFVVLSSIFFLYIGGRDGTLAGIISGFIFSLACLAFAALGYAAVKFFKALAKNDKEKIKTHIETCFKEIRA